MTAPAAGPAARRLARERGLQLRRLRGSGRRGRITVADVAQACARPPCAPRLTARADLSDLLARLPALAALSARQEPPLTPLLLKAAAVALRAGPDLTPLRVAAGEQRWALGRSAPAGSLGIAALTRMAAAARVAPAAAGAAACGASLRLDGPVTGAAFRDGAIRARSHLDLTLEGPAAASAAPFVRTLVELLESPPLLLSA